MPHVHCYLDRPSLVWTMVATDSLIGLSYVSISCTLYVLVRRIRLPFRMAFLAFGAFILACGATHFLEVYNLWIPNYWLAAFVKLVTATASLVTAVYLFSLFPRVLEFAETARDISRAKIGLEEALFRRLTAPPILNRLLRKAVLLPITLAVSLIAIAFLEANYLRATQNWVDHSNEVIRLASDMRFAGYRAQTEMRGFYFTGQESFLHAAGKDAEAFESNLARLRPLVSDNPVQENKITEIGLLFSAWKKFTLSTSGTNRGPRPELVSRNEEMTEALAEATSAFLLSERDLRTDRASHTEMMAIFFFGTIALLTLALGSVFAVFGRGAIFQISTSYGRVLESERKAHEDLRRALTSRDDFFSIASHELKTPLTSLKLKAQLAKRGEGPEPGDKTRKFVFDVNEQVERLVRLVDDMLDISRFRAGTLPMELEHFDLSSLVRANLERMAPQLKAKGMKLELFLASPVPVHADRLRIEQAFSNIVVNAMKYAPAKPLHVSVSAAGGRARIRVRDEGPGVPEQDRERIFERFERGGAVEHVGGLGVGLFLARSIAEAHQGSLILEATGGGGASFVIELPEGSAPLGAGPEIHL